MSLASLPSVNTRGLALLMLSEQKYKEGDVHGAVDDFKEASTVMQKDVISKIYWHVWDLAKRPSGIDNFGEEVMMGRITSDMDPDNITKAEAIRLAVVKYHMDTVGSLTRRLEAASTCSLSRDIMSDPVIDFDGHTFDRSQIQEHYRHLLRNGKYNIECPHSREKGSSALIPNYTVKEIVTIYKEFGERLGHLALFVQSLFNETEKLKAEKECLTVENKALELRQIQPEQALILSQFQRLMEQSVQRERVFEEQFRVWGEERKRLTQQIAELRELQVLATSEQLRMTQRLVEGQRQLGLRQEQLDTAQQELAGAQRQLSQRHLELINLQQELAAVRAELALERQSRELDRSSSQKVLESYSGMDFCQRFTFLVTGY